MEKLTQESMLLLKKGMKPKKVLKMFGEPEVKDRPGDVQKRMFGENLERTNYSPDYKKKLLSMGKRQIKTRPVILMAF